MDEGAAALVDERGVVGDLLDHSEACWVGAISFAQVPERLSIKVNQYRGKAMALPTSIGGGLR